MWCKFQDCMDVRDGTHDSPKYTQEGYPLITSKDFKNGQFDFSKTRYISEVDYKNIIKRSKVDIGDILYSMIGGNIGSMIYIQHDNYFDMAIKNVALFKPYQNSDISTKYIAYFLESKIKEYQAIAIGGAQPFVGLDIFRNTLVPLPPLAEQHRIITEIEKWLALIDQIEQGKVDLQTIIKQTKSKILDLAIHGKLVPQDPNDEPAIKLLKRINPDFTPCDNGHYPNIPFDIPRNWIWVELGKIGRWQSGSTPNRLNKAYYGGNIPWLKTGDLNDGYITHIPEYITEKALNETSVKLNPIGSVLIAMYGATIGKIGILTFAATTNQACCACDVFEGIEKEYLFYFLLSHKEEFIKLGGGGAQPNISKEKIVSTYIPLPPNAEQIRIIKTIHQLFDQLDIITESL
ncbi:restriction endonuclease subunit S [Bacteroides uniformis]|nr:restriction endonuclease subunit S [Bacteroides uniformis]MBO1690759.1 restriction endonuclease subunit S [Bacteroides uniformis]